MKTKYFLLISLTVTLVSCMDDFNPPANTYRGNFETLWKIVDTQYCYLDYKNINWDSIYTVYEILSYSSPLGDFPIIFFSIP